MSQTRSLQGIYRGLWLRCLARSVLTGSRTIRAAFYESNNGVPEGAGVCVYISFKILVAKIWAVTIVANEMCVCTLLVLLGFHVGGMYGDASVA